MDQRKKTAWALVTCTALLVLLMAMLPTASGQSMTGQISGTVLDPQSAVVPGATVTLTNELTGQTREMVSGSQGEFLFTQLLSGTYAIRVNASGFKAYGQKGITLSANEKVALSGVQLEIGTTSETVEVTADSMRVETQSSERTGLISATQVAELAASPDRSFTSLLKVVPGVTTSGGLNVLGGRSGQAVVTLDGIVDNDTGVQTTGSGWVNPNVDAISEMKVMLSNYTAEYGIRAGGTINVSIKNGTRDFHGSAYYFKRHEKLNANEWNNNRNNIAKSRYRYDNPGYTIGGPVIIPGTGFNESREKLFFFWSQEWLKTKNPSGAQRRRFPTDLERIGDFSQTVDASGNLYVVTDPSTGLPFDGNVIPSSRADVVGQAFLNFFPSPNRTDWSDGDNTYNWVDQWVSSERKDQQILRIDWNVAPQTLIYGRYVKSNDPNEQPVGFATAGNWPLVGTTWNQHALGFVGTWIQTFSSSIVNEFTFGLNRGIQDNTAFEGELERVVRSNIAGIADLQQFHPENNPLNIMPAASFGGLNQDLSVDNRFLFHGNNTLYNISDNFSWVKGSHSLKFGFYFEYTSRNSVRESNRSGAFDFSPDTYNPFDSGLGMANAFLGTVRTYQESDLAQDSHARYRDVEFYAQDSWRVNRRLTIDIGARFQNMSPTWYDGQQLAIFQPELYDASTAMKYIYPTTNGMGKNPYTGEIVAPTLIGSFAAPAGVTYTPEEMYPAVGVFDEKYLNNPGVKVSPRVGFAYDVFGDGKMAIRGGFGMFYDRSGGDDIQAQALQVAPIQNLATIWYSQVSQLGSAAFTYSPGSRFYAVGASQRDFSAPTSYNWSLGIQREVGLGFVVDVSYVGTVGRHMRRSKGINSLLYGTKFLASSINPDTGIVYPNNFLRPYQGYDSISYVSFDDSSNYHSMQLSLNRRFGDKLTIGGNWTWSKVMDYAAGGGGPFGGGASAFMPDELFYGKASTDRTHNVVINWTYKMPGLSNHIGNNIIAKQVFDGWQVSGIATFISGTPQSVSWSTNVPGTDVTGSDVSTTRVDLTGNPILSNPTGIQSLLNTTAVSVPLYGAANCEYGDLFTCGFGNAPKDVFRGPGTNNWDISIFKNFQLGSSEERSLQFRWETYNTFNHTQYSSVDTSGVFNSSGEQISTTFGQYNGAASARKMVFALKLKF